MKNFKNLFFVILLLCLNTSYCQQKTVYEKKIEELTFEFFKNLGASQAQINYIEKTHNTEEINELVKKLGATNEGIEKYSRELIRFNDELKKAEVLKTEIEREKSENSKKKLTAIEEFNKLDNVAMSKDQGENFQENDTLNKVYSLVELDVQPQFPGGSQKFNKYWSKNYKGSNEDESVGKVYINFIIEKDGSLTNIKVSKVLGSNKGDEALRVLKSSPKWIPGEIKGERVRCSASLTISI